MKIIEQIRKSMKLIIIFFVLLALLIPLTINLAILNLDNIVYSNRVGISEWIGFYGSYFGGILGGFITLIGVLVTINYYKNQNDVNRKNNIKPRVVFKSKEMIYFYKLWDKDNIINDKKNIYPDLYYITNIKQKKLSNKKYYENIPYLQIYNIGSGVLKELSITWNNNVESLIKKINEIDINNYFDISLNNERIKINKNRYKRRVCENIDYILPVNIEKSSFEININKGLLMLLSVYFHLLSINQNKLDFKKNKLYEVFKDEIKLKFYDYEGEEYTNKYQIKVYFDFFEDIEVEGLEDKDKFHEITFEIKEIKN